MSMTDPISDMLTRLRNGQRAGKLKIDMPLSKIKKNIVQLLKTEGYIKDYQLIDSVKPTLVVELKYYKGFPVIGEIKRVSTPGLRVYRGKNNLPKVYGGLGVAIISTSSGVMTDKAARSKGIGGEVLCYIS
ncbi:30S ribosomal protein S8 [Candidatus Nitrosacidococcus tergens]|uniref:Small ribosomal subunit protein uS8 n=1 Tax=Candidatus Nitrosacidococcus tergens TaxID=553981 RepID=A0A7G1Q819_9GAMM|nr:30S ribosomal protein S8 [Candidatus Nitrosacidococcus tergens]CAB1274835.1 30S ribosomal subunit protein S8 [Candidatus Nitrosacidococcus tergens]